MADQHVLVVASMDGRLTYALECPEVTDECRAWVECLEEHELASDAFRDADGDPAATVLDEAEDDGDNEPEAHGMRHKRIDGACWWTPTEECLYAGWDPHGIADVASGLRFPPGRYPVKVDLDRSEYLEISAGQGADV